jgi:hypothetical protein
VTIVSLQEVLSWGVCLATDEHDVTADLPLILFTNIRNRCLLLQSCRIYNFLFSSNFAPPPPATKFCCSLGERPTCFALVTDPMMTATVTRSDAGLSYDSLRTQHSNLLPKVRLAFTRRPSRSGAPGGVAANAPSFASHTLFLFFA